MAEKTDKSSIIQKAQSYAAKGQIDKAVSEWQKLLSITPSDGNVYNTIGDLYLKKGTEKDAVEAYLKAAESFSRAGFHLKAIAVYRKVIKIDPSRWEVGLALGDLHAERGLLTNAIDEYRNLINHYLKEARLQEARDVYKKIIQLDPKDTGARLKLADLYVKEQMVKQAVEEYLSAAEAVRVAGKAKEAEDLYQRVLTLDPENEKAKEVLLSISAPPPSDPDVLLRQADTLIQQGALDEAEKIVRQLLESDPTQRSYHQSLGYILLQKADQWGAFAEFKLVTEDCIQREEFDGAERLLKDYLTADPQRSEAHGILAEVYEKTGNTDLAVEEYTTMLRLSREAGDPQDVIDGLYKKVCELDPECEAAREYKATSLSPPPEPPVSEGLSLEALLNEVDVYLKYGLVDKALEHVKNGLSRYPDDARLHSRLKTLFEAQGLLGEVMTECLVLARMYREQGKWEEREAVLQDALRIDPDNPALKEELACQAGVSSRPEEASGEATPDVMIPEVGVEFAFERGKEDVVAEEKVSSTRDVADLLTKASALLNKGSKGEAKELYQQVLQLQPGHPVAQAMIMEIETEQEVEASFSSFVGGEEAPPEKQRVDSENNIAEILSTLQQNTAPPIHVEEREEFFDLTQVLEDEFDRDMKGEEPQTGEKAPAGDEDGETHYNLGIAYREMGLISEAIKEFLIAQQGEERFIDSCSMLATCYREKGLHPDAVEQLKKALLHPSCTPKRALWLKYDLGKLYEKNGQVEEALQMFNEVYESDRHFKDVTQWIGELMARRSPSLEERAGRDRETRPVQSEKKGSKKGKISYL